MGKLWIGTSGWIYKHWRDVFYPPDVPQRLWFAHYAAHFDTVEINNTFYHLPGESAFDNWCKQAPPGFLYAVKVSRYITHMRKLHDAAEPLELFLGRARRLDGHLGPLLYQLPPFWHRNDERLEDFLKILPDDLLHVFEFRHDSWFAPEVLSLLERYGAILCTWSAGEKGSPIPSFGRAFYLRMHGAAGFGGKYSPGELQRWAGIVQTQHDAGRDVYVYFNNDPFGHAVQNAFELRGLLGLEQR